MTWRRLAVTAVYVLGTAACSSDGDGADPEPSSAPSVTADEATVEMSTGTAPSTAPQPTTPATPSPAPPPASPSPGASTAPTAPPEEAPPITTDDGIAVPAGDEPTVLGPLSSTEIELDTGGGTVQIGSGEVPDLVPASFPRPDDLVVQTASETGQTAGFTGVSELGFDALVRLYRDGLEAAGYVVTEGTFAAGSFAVFGYEGSDGGGEVVISAPAPGGGQSVIVTFER